MHLRYDRICNDLFITQSMPSPLVKFFFENGQHLRKLGARVECLVFF